MHHNCNLKLVLFYVSPEVNTVLFLCARAANHAMALISLPNTGVSFSHSILFSCHPPLLVTDVLDCGR